MKKTVLTSISVLLIFLFATAIFAAEKTVPLKVACIGDSITYGFGIKKRSENSYSTTRNDVREGVRGEKFWCKRINFT